MESLYMNRSTNALELISGRLNDLERDQERIADALERIADLLEAVIDEDTGTILVSANTYEQN